MPRTYSVTLSETEYNALRRIVGLFMADPMQDTPNGSGVIGEEPWEREIVEALGNRVSVNLREFMGPHYNSPNASRVANVLRKLGWTRKVVYLKRPEGGYKQKPLWFAPLPNDPSRDLVFQFLGSGIDKTTIEEVCQVLGWSTTDTETLGRVQRALVANRWEGEPGKHPLDLERVWRRS